jgi:Mrp family chromosome partitioning ATPase
VPVHGTIPRRTKAAIAAGFCDAIGHGPFFEAFRLLRASIARMAEPGKPMTILIISASKSDGKTTVATNLAKSLADSGKQVVLVDGDLHLSRLKALQPHTHPGLIGWMQTGKRPEIDFWPGEKFKLLAAGAAEEAGSINLDGERLGAIFTELKSQFDFIVIDSPPLPTVSDGLLLGEFADLILSVVSVSNTTKRSFATHNELIETLDRPHGIIINGVENESYEGKDAYFLNDAISPKKFIGRFKMNLL